MRALDDQTTETLHVYVVPEDQLPKKPDFFSLFMLFIGLVLIAAIIFISVFSVAPHKEVSFTISVQSFHLTPASKMLNATVIATGNGHTPATTATGIITFYNGQTYTQIIPVATKLTGADGVSVLTDEQAVIPPAAQTFPPTYGQVRVSAHALVAGVQGNIRAGDINMPCCITSVIAQNPYNFSGGRNARDFTYLTQQDILQTISPLLPTLQSQTLSILPDPRLNPSCSTVTASSPRVGKETKTATVTIAETCKADSYSEQSVIHAISTYSKRFGKGTLTHMQLFEVSIKKQAVLLYVTGQWEPFESRRYWAGK
ncbi:MAG TPA: baseplate J/gp47 family protein [Ktedonobacteraceae bacterium]